MANMKRSTKSQKSGRYFEGLGKLVDLLAPIIMTERAWKYQKVHPFFEQTPPQVVNAPKLISILQPVLSGDPTMAYCLERSLQLKCEYPFEVIWLLDEDDLAGQQICQELVARYPDKDCRLVLLPPPGERESPKAFKLVEGVKHMRGDIVCVLDDDTMLPDHALEQCLPYLDQPGVGLAFGLPYYVNFSSPWSTMVSIFVNSNSLMTYIPYTSVTEPFTINGMFYMIKRDVLASIGGFEAIVHMFADDFAIAHAMRQHGYTLAQTPVRHGISTEVQGPGHFFRLIQRWFIFPRESLLYHLSWFEKIVIFALGVVPIMYPLLLVLALLLAPSWKRWRHALLYFGVNTAIVTNLNQRYLQNAIPRKKRWWIPVMQVIFPFQLLIAFCSPQRPNWRGNIVQVERGGTFHYLKRRHGNL